MKLGIIEIHDWRFCGFLTLIYTSSKTRRTDSISNQARHLLLNHGLPFLTFECISLFFRTHTHWLILANLVVDMLPHLQIHLHSSEAMFGLITFYIGPKSLRTQVEKRIHADESMWSQRVWNKRKCSLLFLMLLTNFMNYFFTNINKDANILWYTFITLGNLVDVQQETCWKSLAASGHWVWYIWHNAEFWYLDYL